MEKLYYATCQLFFEDLLEQELTTLGATSTERSVGGVFFNASEPVMYRVLIHARTIASLRLVLLQSDISEAKDLYQKSLSIAWFEYFSQDDLFACHVSSSGKNIAPENYLMLVMKDGIVDSFRKIGRARPNINNELATHYVHLQVVDNHIVIALELEHELFKRGYRTSLDEENQEMAKVKLIKKRKSHNHPAPLKEHLAASLLYRAHWLEEVEQSPDKIFYDPMCGSGTIVIEAFMMAYQMSPQWLRQRWRIKHWRGFNATLFEQEWKAMALKYHQLLSEHAGLTFWASDKNEHAVAMTRLATEKLGIAPYIKVFNQDFFDTKRPPKAGFILSNPPYGERMGSRDDANRLYAQLGQHLKTQYQQWQVALLAPDSDILRCLDIRSERINTFFNGAKRAVLLRFMIEDREEQRFVLSDEAQELKALISEQFARRKAEAQELYATNAFRFYNAESPLYSATCEYFAGAVVVQEFVVYRSREEQAPAVKQVRTTEFLRIIQEVTGLPKMDIYHKQRRPASSKSQYDKEASVDALQRVVKEGGLEFIVNLSTYIDVGLYLDHRYLRREVMKRSQGKRFLNLFSYTASMSVAAAVGGAIQTVSVDASKTYLIQAKSNFERNHIDLEGGNHRLVRRDIKKYLRELESEEFDMIYLDPPTFSNGKGRDALDIQKDHGAMITHLMDFVSRDGVLYFSVHYRRFRMDERILRSYNVTDLTKVSHDKDFDGRLEHYLWSVEHRV